MPPSNHAETDYAGGSFGRPDSRLLTKSWRIQKNFLKAGDRAFEALDVGAAASLFGQDAVTVGNLAAGLSVYAGYCYGTYTNISAIKARFPSARHVSITPRVQYSVPAMCLDVEPGDATPADCPAFQRIAGHDGSAKPVYYTSAGDLQAVINALAAAGFPRNSYWLWSAHWIGEHICGRATCGYPDADATQYASNAYVDSDVFRNYMFGPAPVVRPVLHEGSSGADVVTLRQRLDYYGAALPPGADGGPAAFGKTVLAAVEAFQKVNFGPAGTDGIVGPKTWGALLSSTAKHIPPAPVPPAGPPPPKPKPLPPAPLSVTPQRYLDIGRAIAGYTGQYATTVKNNAGVIVAAEKSTKPSIVVHVPGPGTYTVITTADGHAPSTKTVTV